MAGRGTEGSPEAGPEAAGRRQPEDSPEAGPEAGLAQTPAQARPRPGPGPAQARRPGNPLGPKAKPSCGRGLGARAARRQNLRAGGAN